MTNNRWIVALAGTVAMACLGTAYSWSIFTQPLIASFGWSNATTTWTFAICILFLGIGAVIGGRWQLRVGARAVTVVGMVVWGIGNVLAGLGTARLGAWWMYLTYGIIGGLGNGLAYIVPVAAVTKWFPDKRGLGSGMVVMGFGLGAFFYNNIAKSVPSFALASRHAATAIGGNRGAMTQGDTSAVMTMFVISGVVFLVLGGLCAMLVRDPPADYARAASAAATAARTREFTPAEAMRTWQFWSLWLMLFLNVTAGILFISNAVPIMRELTGAPPASALAVYGFIALFNGLGRFFWGAVSDRIGRNFAFLLIYALQVAIFFAVGAIHSLPLVATLFGVVLLCYGGGFGTMPSFTADYFGTRHMGEIYGWILLAWGVGGVVGPMFVAFVKDHTGSFHEALPITAIVLVVAMLLPLFTRAPGRERSSGFVRRRLPA